MKTTAYVRELEKPALPPPPGTTGLPAWLRQNLFASAWSALVTLVIGFLLALIAWQIIDWALIRGVFSGQDREACAIEGAGACWPFVWAKFPQWLFGFYPIAERWRPTLVFLIGAAAFVPMLMPSAPYKTSNALFLGIVFPVIAIILLSGGNFDVGAGGYVLLGLLALLAGVVLPMASLGLEEGVKSNRAGVGLALLGLVPAFLWLIAEAVAAASGLIAVLGSAVGLGAFDPLGGVARALTAFRDSVIAHAATPYVVGGAIALAAAFSAASLLRRGPQHAWGTMGRWLAVAVAALGILLLLDMDFGLVPVETSNWGGLLVTLVVSVTGIAVSLPLGILLALGRRSRMPIVRLFSVIFIEVWRGVPLITVLFMSSVMLPLFLPEGLSFDKLLRALIGISLFSAAYMAEVVRGGLQAIGKGQYEGAMALGLSYWQMMWKIVLPQALKVSIPNIVSTFIGLFKDTTLVLIIGIFDFLGIITAGTQDAKWASDQTGNTGYFVAAIIYWAFCFGMSRYAMFTESRLSAASRR